MAVIRDNPYSAFNFQVTLEGVNDGSVARTAFTEVSGLGVEITPIEYRTGAEDITVRKIPGLKKFSNITLKRGVTGDMALFKWIDLAMNGRVQRVNGTITLLDESREAVMTWRIQQAWPCKYSGPSLAAKGGEVAIEELELCHEGLKLE